MRIDLVGKKARCATGETFSRSSHNWSFLMHAVFNLVDPSITARCHNWMSCDGQGLNEHDALSMAEELQHHIGPRGELTRALEELTLRRNAPNEGWDQDDFGALFQGIADLKFLIEEEIPEFIAFLRQCGGFEIC